MITPFRRDIDPAQLKRDAERAAVVRAHQTDPDVIALQVSRTRDLLDLVIWVGIAAGLLWTAANVQAWVANGAPVASIAWWVAWLTTAPVEVTLVAILIGEQHAARYGQRVTGVTHAARIGLLVIMGVLNVWHPFELLADGDPVTGSAGMLAAHIGIPAAIVLACEAVTGLRGTLDAAVTSAAQRAADRPTPGRRRRHRAADPDTSSTSSTSSTPPPDPPADPPDPDVESDTRPVPDAAGLLVRELGVRWALLNWGEHGAPAPKDIRAGLERDHDRPISQSESSKIRTDALARYLEQGGQHLENSIETSTNSTEHGTPDEQEATG